ncbi:LysR family transcriptional regulator [Burkholderia pyrrocinia]|uniref:LysR family transcriptional regulator n=1 Tax=Burkholderia TaxID=32008 RepID=UPI00128E871D|nr:hypothetical protein [Burkholderia sp. BE17]
MESWLLRCFLAVSEERHFTHAVEQLYIEQLLFSRVIKEREEEGPTRAAVHRRAHAWFAQRCRTGGVSIERTRELHVLA